MTVLGHWLILLAVLVAASSTFLYYGATKRTSGTVRLARRLLYVVSLLVFVGSGLLLTLILTHDFTNGYVYSYSDRSLPLHFLMSTFYAGQEGSFLFWALCAVLIGLALSVSTKKQGTEPMVMTVYMGVTTALLLLLAAKSPFRSLWEMFPDAPAGFVPDDGRGLNPLLQNFWMVIHPPVLFVGFAAMGVPFAYAVAGLWHRRYDLLPRQALPWILFAVAVLGLGIMLGAYWAYGVLGWGGYWGWDPVENSSLIPWVIGIALVHTLLAQLRTGKYVRTNFLLAIFSFFFVIYSTFLTRSGILADASVHSFAEAEATVYWLLVGVLASVAVVGLGMLALRYRDMVVPDTVRSWLTRETALGLGALVLLLSAVVILFGTSLPIVSTTRVEPSFYDAANLPMAILMGLLIGVSLYLQWESEDGPEALRRSWKIVLAAAVLTIVLVVAGVRDVLLAAFAFASIFALLVNLDIAVRVARGNWRFIGGKVAHIGLALFFLGVISTGKYADSKQLVLPQNESREALGYTFTYTGNSQRPDGKYEFHVKAERGGESFTLAPVMFEAGQQGIMRNPDIASFLTKDIYVSPVSLQPAEEHSHGEATTTALTKGEAATLHGASVTFREFEMGEHSGSMQQGGAMRIGAKLDVVKNGKSEQLTPVMVYRPNAAPEYVPVRSELMGTTVRLMAVQSGGMGGGASTVTIALDDGAHASEPESLVVEASVKPFVNLLWIGTLVMMIGFGLSIVKRSKES